MRVTVPPSAFVTHTNAPPMASDSGARPTQLVRAPLSNRRTALSAEATTQTTPSATMGPSGRRPAGIARPTPDVPTAVDARERAGAGVGDPDEAVGGDRDAVGPVAGRRSPRPPARRRRRSRWRSRSAWRRRERPPRATRRRRRRWRAAPATRIAASSGASTARTSRSSSRAVGHDSATALISSADSTALNDGIAAPAPTVTIASTAAASGLALVEVRPDRAGGVGGRERVAARAAGGGETASPERPPARRAGGVVSPRRPPSRRRAAAAPRTARRRRAPRPPRSPRRARDRAWTARTGRESRSRR